MDVRGERSGFFEFGQMFLHDFEGNISAVGAESGGVFDPSGPEAPSYLSSACLAPGGIVAQGGFVLYEAASFQFAVLFGECIGNEYSFPEGDFHGLSLLGRF